MFLYALNQYYTLLTGAATCCLQGNSSSNFDSLQTTMAPLCNLLIAPSEKNVSLLTNWLDAALKCHSEETCPDQRDLDSCPPTRPHYGVGIVIPLS